MSIRIVETTVSDKAEALMPLLQMHRDELATNKVLMQLEPNWEMYRALEESGALLALLVYVDDEIIGYSANFIMNHCHYNGLKYAQNDVLFLAPAFRGGSIGLKLIRETERVVRERGAKMMMWHAKEGTPLHGIMRRLGYKVQDIVYGREI